VLAVALVAVTLAVRWPLLDVPMERDEGEYAYMAQGMARGDAPYVSSFCQKPPGVFLVYWVAMSMGGESLRSIRLAAAVFAGAGAAVVGVWTARHGSALAGWGAGLALALTTATPAAMGFTANTEQFLLLPWTAAVALAFPAAGEVGDEVGARRSLIIGLLAGSALLIKPVAAPLVVILLLRCVWSRGAAGGIQSNTRVARALSLVGGALLPLALVGLWLYAAGALAAALDSAVYYNLEYVGSLPPGRIAAGAALIIPKLTAIAANNPGVWLMAALCGLWLAGSRAPGRGWLALLWAASIAAVSTGWYFWSHYFLLLSPAAAFTLGAGLNRLRDRVGGSLAGRLRHPAIGYVALTLAQAAPTTLACREYLFELTPAAVSFRIFGQEPFEVAPEIGSYVRAHTGEHDRVLVWGSEPELLFYAGRRSATRYTIFYPLWQPYRSNAQRHAELTGEIQSSRPRFVIVVLLGSSHYYRLADRSPLWSFVRDLTDTQYRLVGFATPQGPGEHGPLRLHWRGGCAADGPDPPQPMPPVLIYERDHLFPHAPNSARSQIQRPA
jgi:hypothetical protein